MWCGGSGCVCSCDDSDISGACGDGRDGGGKGGKRGVCESSGSAFVTAANMLEIFA